MHDIVLPKSRLKRIRNSYRYPAQAALVARTPLLGRRVPMRSMWRREPLGMALRAERAMTSRAGGPPLLAGICGAWGDARTIDAARGAVAQAVPVARELGGQAGRALRSVPIRRLRPGRLRQRVRGITSVHVPVPAPQEVLAGLGSSPPVHLAEGRRARGRPAGATAVLVDVRSLAAGAAIGALAVYYLDPHQGRRRRALLRDKLAHFRNVVTRELPQKASRRVRFLSGVAKGVRHNALELVHSENGRIEDDETLVARVRSEVLRDPRYKPGEIHVDAYEGCVTLRGQLDNPADIERLINATKHVEGVREVRSYLHLPDTLPPNKAEVYRASEVHLPAI